MSFYQTSLFLLLLASSSLFCQHLSAGDLVFLHESRGDIHKCDSILQSKYFVKADFTLLDKADSSLIYVNSEKGSEKVITAVSINESSVILQTVDRVFFTEFLDSIGQYGFKSVGMKEEKERTLYIFSRGPGVVLFMSHDSPELEPKTHTFGIELYYEE